MRLKANQHNDFRAKASNVETHTVWRHFRHKRYSNREFAKNDGQAMSDTANQASKTSTNA